MGRFDREMDRSVTVLVELVRVWLAAQPRIIFLFNRFMVRSVTVLVERG